MSQDIPRFEAQPREKLGTRYAARLRDAGQLPAVIYGHGQDPAHITLDARQVSDVLHDNAQLVELAVADSQAEPCLIKDVQWNYLGSEIIHIDLTRVNLDEEVQVEVEIEFVGECKELEKPGAVLEHPITQLEISCKANAIPESITCDITELTEQDPISAGQLELPDGVTLETDPETTIASIQIVAELPEPEEGDDDAAEPEVIGEEADDSDDPQED